MIAQFGLKTFVTSSNKIYTFDNLTYSSSLQLETQTAVNRKPTTNVKGSALNKIKLKILLCKEFNVDPKKELDEWEKIKDDAKPYFFILGTKTLGMNKYLLNDISCSDIKVNKDGEIISIIISLSFQEYISPGEVVTKSENQSIGLEKSDFDATNAYGVRLPSAAEKSQMKRKNSKMQYDGRSK